jgi:hypothetical protein
LINCRNLENKTGRDKREKFILRRTLGRNLEIAKHLKKSLETGRGSPLEDEGSVQSTRPMRRNCCRGKRRLLSELKLAVTFNDFIYSIDA